MYRSLVFLNCIVLLATWGNRLYAQTDRKETEALLLTESITIDGKLSEGAWKTAPKAMGFTQIAPEPGEPASQKTWVSVLYDDEAVYVGAMMYESSPDSILRQLSPRDDYESSNTDAFAVTFDTYLDRQNATQFVVTAAGVQVDAIAKFDGVDRSWNAAWYSRVSLNDSGWCVEMKIPYSALRFSKEAIQQWGVNFYRLIRRHREQSYWNEVNPAVQNVIGQSGTLNGIHDIKSPIRLAFLPYVSSYVEDYDGKQTKSLNGGMDIKYGLSESFTLDMTLVPDFGQTLFDNKVLNLSPVEVRYNERRYFFTEGVDLFKKNDLFYSRRVGGTPVNLNSAYVGLDSNEYVAQNPATTRLYNAAKVSGRTKTNTGIGIFNAVSAPTNATVRDSVSGIERKVQTSPFTNYSVIVVDQALKNNSYVSLVNTNVYRKENSYNANVSAVLFKFADRNNTYGVSGSADVSQLYTPGSNDVGHRGQLTFGKQSGNYTWSVQSQMISDRFNPNDLGYLGRNNMVSCVVYNSYNTYKPFWIVNNTYNKIGLEYYRSFNPDAYSRSAVHGNHTITLKSFHSMGAYWDWQPEQSYDYFEPRTPGRFFVYPKNNMVGGFLSSDYRRQFALDGELSNRWFGGISRNTFYWRLAPRFRFSNKLSAVYGLSREHRMYDVGFVNRIADSIILGTRTLTTTTNTLSAAYIFNRTMSLKLEARHYWSQAEYSEYGLLGNDGLLTTLDEYNADKSDDRNHNINYNSFNVFLNFVWQFKPGSEMSVVYQNSIYASGKQLTYNYFDDIDYTFRSPQGNSLSVKIIYFLDYLTIDKFLHANKDKSS